MKLTTLIVDDEQLAREGLRLLLAEDPDISAIHEAKDGESAVTAIHNLGPDVVFLDVQMPEMDGFSVVREIDTAHLPAIVFVTAHDQYAIQAFEINAVDYLLKPVTRERFSQALERAKSRLRSGNSATQQMLSLLETIASPVRRMERVAIRSAGKTYFVDIKEIDYIEAAENYVQLHVGKASHLLRVSMDTLEKSLDADTFLRVHRSIIINTLRVKELQPDVHGEYVIVLKTNVRLRSGRSYHERIKSLMSNPF